MPSKSLQNREISQIVESQMRHWERLHRESSLREKQLQLVESEGVMISYITISREVGSGGSDIARKLSELIGWQVYDKEILDFMAEDMAVRKELLETVDESTIGWIEEWIDPIFNRQSVKQLEYYKHLLKVLLVISRHGQAIILGRAAGQVLPRERGLSIRVVAPLELRCRRYAERNNIDLKEARKTVAKMDKMRQDFTRQFANKDICDCKNYYDMVINTAKFTPTSAAKLIWRCLDQRQAGQSAGNQ